MQAKHKSVPQLMASYTTPACHLVKSVFKALVPAYCLAQALALSAQAGWRAEGHGQTAAEGVRRVNGEGLTVLVYLLKVCLLLNPLAHVKNAQPLERRQSGMKSWTVRACDHFRVKGLLIKEAIT